jgi:hypothetical protein
MVGRALRTAFGRWEADEQGMSIQTKSSVSRLPDQFKTAIAQADASPGIPLKLRDWSGGEAGGEADGRKQKTERCCCT